jgi:hypothetical protein
VWLAFMARASLDPDLADPIPSTRSIRGSGFSRYRGSRGQAACSAPISRPRAANPAMVRLWFAACHSRWKRRQ